MKKVMILGLVLCSTLMVRAGTIDLGTWVGDKSFSAFLAGESSGGTPVYSSSYCDLFSDHILMNKWTYVAEVQYQFKAGAPIIDSVTLDLDQYQWDPESSSGNTLYINVNGTVVQRVDLPASSQIGSVGPATIHFDSPVDTVTIRIQRYLRWGGDNQGNLNIYESPNLGNTPWVFHAVEPIRSVNLGTWESTKPYQMQFKNTPVYETKNCQFYEDHLNMMAGTDSYATWEFDAEGAIIRNVKLDIDQVNWKPQDPRTHGVFFFQVTDKEPIPGQDEWATLYRVTLPGYPEGDSEWSTVLYPGSFNYTFAEPVSKVWVRMYRYIPWAGYPSGILEPFDSASMGNTPWEFRRAVAGDANGDGMVDVGDLGILAANYGEIAGSSWSKGDFNSDGAVDVGDLGILAAHYGEGVANPSSADFNADYAKVFGTTVSNDDALATGNSSLACSTLGLPLVAGLVLMGLMLVKLEE